MMLDLKRKYTHDTRVSANSYCTGVSKEIT